MTVTGVISSCRAEHRSPVRVACRALGMGVQKVATSRVATSSTRIISLVKNGSP